MRRHFPIFFISTVFFLLFVLVTTGAEWVWVFAFVTLMLLIGAGSCLMFLLRRGPTFEAKHYTAHLLAHPMSGKQKALCDIVWLKDIKPLVMEQADTYMDATLAPGYREGTD